MTEPIATPVWFITGCSSGLGRALAARVLAHGHRVVATARQPATLADLAADYPATCRTLTLDVTHPDQVTATVSAAAAVFGQLDVIVNNAGYGLIGALEELGEDQITRNFETNFFGAVRVTRAALPFLRTQRRGHFVFISAAAAIANYPGFSIYGATKCALEGVAEALAAEVRPFGLRVTLVQPGPFRTTFVGPALEAAAHPLAAYDSTSGKFRSFLEKMSGTQPGDPDRAADAIIAAVAAERPPLRLVLGAYATDKLRRKLATAARELETWSPTGLPTDFAP